MDKSETIIAFVSANIQTRAARYATELIHTLTPLTRDMVLAINPKFDNWEQLISLAKSTNYPLAAWDFPEPAPAVVSIWAGTYASEEEFYEYTELSYSECGAQSDFLTKFRLEDIDEDFMEIITSPEPQVLEHLLAGTSYFDEFQHALTKQKSKRNYNCAILLYHYRYTGERVKDTSVDFIGTFSWDTLR